jgi:hypothetical protein
MDDFGKAAREDDNDQDHNQHLAAADLAAPSPRN